MCRRAESAAAWRHASWTSPQNTPATPSCVTTSASSEIGVCSSVRGAVDHRPHRRVHRADHLVAGDQRAEPVREVDDLRRGDAGEQILRAPGETDHLVRKHRPADEHVVVLGDEPVQGDRHVLAQPPAGQIGDLASPECVPSSTNVAGSSQRWLKIADRRRGRPTCTGRPSSVVSCSSLIGDVRAEGDEDSRAPPRVDRARARGCRTSAASASSACRRGSARAPAGRRPAAAARPSAATRDTCSGVRKPSSTP